MFCSPLRFTSARDSVSVRAESGRITTPHEDRICGIRGLKKCNQAPPGRQISGQKGLTRGENGETMRISMHGTRWAGRKVS